MPHVYATLRTVEDAVPYTVLPLTLHQKPYGVRGVASRTVGDGFCSQQKICNIKDPAWYVCAAPDLFFIILIDFPGSPLRTK